MLLIHDLVEIDGGDTWLYDREANAAKADKEQLCAERVFGILPDDQKQHFLELWNEFEARETKEAIFAAALDGMHPLINHQVTGGELIRAAKLTAAEVIDKKNYIQTGSKELWEHSQKIIAWGVKSGLYVE